MPINLRHPFQCILYIERRLTGSHNLFIAAAGPKLYTYAANSGQRLSIWPQDKKENVYTGQGLPSHPEKKRKISPTEDGKDTTTTLESDDAQFEITWSNIPILKSTTNGNYLVLVTGEDKCIRVLEIGEHGILQQLSSR